MGRLRAVEPHEAGGCRKGVAQCGEHGIAHVRLHGDFCAVVVNFFRNVSVQWYARRLLGKRLLHVVETVDRVVDERSERDGLAVVVLG